MINKMVFTRREITDLVAAVMEYNGIRADEFRFVLVDGVDSPVQTGDTFTQDFTVEVSYEPPPLKVRVQPDEENEVRIESVSQAVTMVNEWRKKRQTQPIS